MAKLNHQVIGKLSGKIGNIVFRQRNGKNFASSRPGSFFPGFDAASVGRRDKFGIACKFSSRVYAQPYLKKIWKKYTSAGISPYNYITKINYECAEPDGLTDFAAIVPASSFNAKVISSVLSPPYMQVILDPLGNIPGIAPAAEPVLRLCTIISLTNPNDEYIGRVEFITLVSESQAAVLDAPLTFQVPYSSQEIQVFNSYRDKKVFSALITLDQDENPVHYSNTILL
jgi:hypothetical protein